MVIITLTKGGVHGQSFTIPASTLELYDEGATSSAITATLYVDVTSGTPTNWADLTAADKGLKVTYDRVGSNDGVLLYIDAVSYRVTHTTFGDGGYTQGNCSGSAMSITNPVSLTLGDDQVSSPISLVGFNFKFFNYPVSQLYVSSNGFVSFAAPADDGVNGLASLRLASWNVFYKRYRITGFSTVYYCRINERGLLKYIKKRYSTSWLGGVFFLNSNHDVTFCKKTTFLAPFL